MTDKKQPRLYTEKSFSRLLKQIKSLKFSPDYVMSAKEQLKVDEATALIMKSILLGDIACIHVMLNTEREILYKKLTALKNLVKRKKKKAMQPSQSHKFGGGNFFDGKERRPINKLSNLGTVKK